ncbi:syntaxin, Qa-SNARE family, putative [Plasmodium malariae]|uniref:Syntaxin, Qa-SNARE family, putative n=1 Tax=Plasmodium malariae TaxID=5858 RepID=A0A1C3KC41_PLAMA|nr:syntaxin, Qa-SNARE family, putative [Plasmodium malariae]
MSYSTKKKDSKTLPQKSAYDNQFNLDIQKDIGVIQSYASRISKINENEACSIESSEKVQEIVQEGKLKIQEIQRKLKSYSSNAENMPQNEKMRMKLMLQKLSNFYLDAVNNFQNVSKNYINKTVLNDLSSRNLDVSDNVEYDSVNNFSRKSSSNYDSSKDKFNVNIYDYNFYENENYETPYRNYGSSEFQIEQNAIGGKKKKKKYKNNAFTGHMKNDINEYLLQNDDKYLENEKEEGYSYDKQFVSIKTADIENEILNQKNKEIKQLHKDIINIQELYKELFEQINVQGDNLDNIDSQIINTHDNILMSGREIEITRNRYFRNIRCMGFLVLVLIILIIIILVVFRII